MRHHVDQFPGIRAERIRELNDRYRSKVPFSPDLVMTSALAESLGDFLPDLWRVIRDFDSFTESNDPWEEHDFGQLKVRDIEIFWKIDYYDLNLEYGSPDPSDESLTRRVMTVYLPEAH